MHACRHTRARATWRQDNRPLTWRSASSALQSPGPEWGRPAPPAPPPNAGGTPGDAFVQPQLVGSGGRMARRDCTARQPACTPPRAPASPAWPGARPPGARWCAPSAPDAASAAAGAAGSRPAAARRQSSSPPARGRRGRLPQPRCKSPGGGGGEGCRGSSSGTRACLWSEHSSSSSSRRSAACLGVVGAVGRGDDVERVVLLDRGPLV